MYTLVYSQSNHNHFEVQLLLSAVGQIIIISIDFCLFNTSLMHTLYALAMQHKICSCMQYTVHRLGHVLIWLIEMAVYIYCIIII